jgi:hypothetical protein
MQHEHKPKSFWNRTNIIIILVLVTAFTILAFQFEDDPMLPDTKQTDSTQTDTTPSDENASEKTAQQGNIDAEVTTLIVNKSSNHVNFVGYAVDPNAREKTFEINFYYNQTYLGDAMADGESLPDCDICDNHVFMEEFIINETENLNHSLLQATLTETGNPIPILDSALQLTE